MDRLDKSYITLLDSDQWKILVSDSVSTVMRWSKRTMWCTKGRDDAVDCLDAGDCVAFIQDDMRKPHYLMFTGSGEVWNRKNDPIKTCDFFADNPETKLAMFTAYPKEGEVVEQQLRNRTKRHQEQYWSDEYKSRVRPSSTDLYERLGAIDTVMMQRWTDEYRGVPWTPRPLRGDRNRRFNNEVDCTRIW